MQNMLKLKTNIALLGAFAPAQAQLAAKDIAAAKAAFSANGCNNCHARAETLVGPALKDIATRYKGKKVVGEVARRIIEGSEGRWGGMAHPANAALDPKDAQLLARWILAGAP